MYSESRLCLEGVGYLEARRCLFFDPRKSSLLSSKSYESQPSCMQIRSEVTTIPYTPYQIHLFFMACFASLVAPFGGFFASGFKRAFDIKDFGHSIPGHGGMTDRMDCQ